MGDLTPVFTKFSVRSGSGFISIQIHDYAKDGGVELLAKCNAFLNKIPAQPS